MRRCSICAHPERTKIEALRASGIRLGPLARQFKVDPSQLSRHMKSHVTAAEMSVYLTGTSDVLKLRRLAAEQSGAVLEDLQLARAMTFEAMRDAAQAKDGTRFAALVAKFIDILDAVGRRTGEIAKLNPAITINAVTNNFSVVNHPSFLELQNGLLAIGRAHPDALPKIIALIERLDAPPPHGGAPMIEMDASHAA